MSRLSIRNATRSLRHHIFFICLYFSLPMALLSAALTYQDEKLTLIRDEKLTLIRIVWIFAVCTCAGAIGAFVGWYFIIPLIRRRSDHKVLIEGVRSLF